MNFFDKYFNWVLFAAVVAVAAIVSVHFVQTYERLTAKRPEMTVTIPEGFTMYDIDRTLSDDGVLGRGEFVAAATTGADASATTGVSLGISSLEGRLFPDTYDFYVSSTATSVIQKFLTNFNAKAAPLFEGSSTASSSAIPLESSSQENDLILASMVQKEVASSTDMAIVAGILEKRLTAGMFLDVDATICYAKQMAEFAASPTSTAGCYPLTATDLRLDSPYNTYRYKGLPPTPIGNPGTEAIQAVLNPQASPYWYYLSDPKTGKTIYAETLAEQGANQREYLGE